MEDLKEKISDLIDNHATDERCLFNEFLNILFWKDYKEGHIDVKDKDSIFGKIKEATKEHGTDCETYYSLDTKKILPFINKIRKQIGLKELTLELHHNCLMEMTEEVKKELMLKKLK